MKIFNNNKIKTIKIFFLAFLLFATGITNAQVGIGTATPAPSAELDVSSTTKGFLPPRMTAEERNGIVNPVPGLMIWCTNCGSSGETEVFNGTVWVNMAGDHVAIQDWMPKNLDVSTYRDGTPIPEVKDKKAWAALTTGAWCYYNNDPATGEVYGKLYNWYAVNDPRGLAPAGWYLPMERDWKNLISFLGGDAVAGSKMKEAGIVHWDTANGGANNSSGFTALGAGFRQGPDGTFMNLRSDANFWSGSEYNTGNARYRNLLAYADFIQTSANYKTSGYSVRCLRERESVKIGTQEWMQRNLDVTTYRNGDPIPEVEDQTRWATTTEGAWCYYNKSSTNGDVYGKLYNWYAVNDPRGLAPKGWHVATDGEWEMLTDYIGAPDVTGGMLKEEGTVHWNSPNNIYTTSLSGYYRAVPGGYRERNGAFKSIRDVGSWWTSTSVNATNAWYRNITNYLINIKRLDSGKGNGMSVRCVKD